MSTESSVGAYQVNTFAELIVWQRPQHIPTAQGGRVWADLIKRFDWSEVRQFLQNNPDFCPTNDNIFRAFQLTELQQVRVVIIGQDPYYTLYNQSPLADGLSFSIAPGAPIPPSLATIRREIQACYPEITLSPNGNLEGWARQGVMMLNRTLTSRRGTPDDPNHRRIWAGFFREVIDNILAVNPEVIVVAWGSKAQEALLPWSDRMSPTPTPGKAYLLTSPHPSPRARGFSGNKHFFLINQYLSQRGQREIDWSM